VAVGDTNVKHRPDRRFFKAIKKAIAEVMILTKAAIKADVISDVMASIPSCD
jgi:hypothetical protein